VVPDAANRFRLCVGAPAFMAAVGEAVESCTQRIRAQFSTFEGDGSGQAFATLLLGAAARGVDVRLSLDHYSDVIVDDITPLALHRRAAVRAERRRTEALLGHLVTGGVALRRTAPVGRLNRYLLFRDHKKMVILDDDVAFTGGLNVSDHNFAWHDFMVRIEGPLVVDLAADFDSTWNGSTTSLATAEGSGEFVLNQCPGRPSIMDELVRMIDGARRTVAIESPYLHGPHIEAALRAAAARGVRVTLVMPARANHVWARVWARALRHRLDHPLVTAHGYPGADGMTHAKLAIVDGKRATFGSCNLLELESLTQKELNVFSDDPDLVGQLEALIDADLAVSRPLAVPASGRGAWTYTVLHALCERWTRRLLRRASWRSEYC
jgi:cardiolipin synthase